MLSSISRLFRILIVIESALFLSSTATPSEAAGGFRPDVSCGMIVDYAEGRVSTGGGIGGGVGISRSIWKRVHAFSAVDITSSPFDRHGAFTGQVPSGGGRRTMLTLVAGLRGYVTEWHYLMLGTGILHVTYTDLIYKFTSHEDPTELGSGTGVIMQVGAGVDLVPTSAGDVFIDARMTFGDADPHGTAYTQFRVGFRFE